MNLQKIDLVKTVDFVDDSNLISTRRGYETLFVPKLHSQMLGHQMFHGLNDILHLGHLEHMLDGNYLHMALHLRVNEDGAFAHHLEHGIITQYHIFGCDDVI